MSAQVVNLKAARKARARADERLQADANAAKFGRTKAGKTLEKEQADKAQRDLDGHLRE